MPNDKIIEEYILFVSSLRNDKKMTKESLSILIEILFKKVYEKYEKVSELYFVVGVSG